VRLGEVVAVRKGKKPVGIVAAARPGYRRLIQIDDLRPDARPKFCPPASGEVLAQPGDVVIAWDGANAATSSSGLSGAIGSTLARLRPVRDGVFTPYLGQFIRSQERYLRERCQGATVPHIDGRVLQALELSLPSMSEQRRIAEVLDRAEGLRAKRRAALAQLDTLTQSIFLDMFGDPARPMGHPSTSSLGEHLDFVTSGSRGWAEFYATAGSRFIRSFDVQMNHFSAEDLAFVVPPDNAEARRTQVRSGDVLLTITGSRIGRVAAVPKELEGSHISQHVAILRVDSKRIEPTFLAYFLSLEGGGQRQIAKAQYGQTKPGLNFEQIRRFQIPVPSIDLQREFVRRVAQVGTLKISHQASLAQLDVLFASLQHRAFAGDL
jgi:type I restriction enzyme, S subunit